MMATVLFAVQMSAKITSDAIDASAPRRERTRAVRREMMYSIPPFMRIISSIPPAIIVMMISCPIESMPCPIVENQSNTDNLPHAIPIMPDDTMPNVKTFNTFIPAMAEISTSR